MLEYTKGNILEADAEALVNTVNCVGVMGKGIALQFKMAYPDNYRFYKQACDKGEIRPGKLYVYETGTITNPKYIINLPTKRHWKGKSRIEDIDKGLIALVEIIRERNISSIAIPPLGCGSGGLEWSAVRSRIEQALAALPQVHILVYGPAGPPLPESMPVRTAVPSMTRARALLIELIQRYRIPGYRLSHLEMQKLAYFLQSAGENLRLNFVAYHYGPYAENLNFVLQRMEGHLIRGYGDRSRDARIRVLPSAEELAHRLLDHDPEASQRLEQVSRLICGFETPYGMELRVCPEFCVSDRFTVFISFPQT